jgi:hypothetical protein
MVVAAGHWMGGISLSFPAVIGFSPIRDVP